MITLKQRKIKFKICDMFFDHILMPLHKINHLIHYQYVHIIFYIFDKSDYHLIS